MMSLFVVLINQLLLAAAVHTRGAQVPAQLILPVYELGDFVKAQTW